VFDLPPNHAAILPNCGVGKGSVGWDGAKSMTFKESLIESTQGEMDESFRDAQAIRARALEIQGKPEEAAAVRRLRPPVFQFREVA
jgi:hypothetical protein